MAIVGSSDASIAGDPQPGAQGISAGSAADTVDRDLPCSTCGYNLRGLSPEGSCPECAAPVAEAVRGERLIGADPRWVARIRLGLALLTGAPLAPMIAAAMEIRYWPDLLGVAALCSPETYRLMILMEVVMSRASAATLQPLFVACAAGLATLLGVTGVWLLTARWPWRRRDPAVRRYSLRVLSILACLAVLVACAQRWGPWPASGMTLASSQGYLLLAILDAAQAGLLMDYLGRLSQRTSDKQLPALLGLSCVLAIARTTVPVIALLILLLRPAWYWPVPMAMFIAAIAAAPLLAILELWCFWRLFKATSR